MGFILEVTLKPKTDIHGSRQFKAGDLITMYSLS